MTNGDKLRTMSNEQLSEFMEERLYAAINAESALSIDLVERSEWIDWLNKEVTQ